MSPLQTKTAFNIVHLDHGNLLYRSHLICSTTLQPNPIITFILLMRKTEA